MSEPAWKCFDEEILQYPLYWFCYDEFNMNHIALPNQGAGALVFLERFLRDYLHTDKFLNDDGLCMGLDKVRYVASVEKNCMRLSDALFNSVRFDAMLAQSQEYLIGHVLEFVFALRHWQQLNRQTNTKEVVPSGEKSSKKRKVQ